MKISKLNLINIGIVSNNLEVLCTDYFEDNKEKDLMIKCIRSLFHFNIREIENQQTDLSIPVDCANRILDRMIREEWNADKLEELIIRMMCN